MLSVLSNNHVKFNELSSTYRSLYDLGLITSSYMERMFASTNFLRGVYYFLPSDFSHVDEYTYWRRIRNLWGFGRKFKLKRRFMKIDRVLYFYNPLLLVFNLKCLSMYIFELSSVYGSVIYLNTAQYNLPIHYMMRWHARDISHSCIGTVWQGGTLSSIGTRFLLVRSCLALPYQAYHNYASRWNIAFGQIITLIKILRHFFYRYEFYSRIRKEVNKLRKIFKMFYYYRYISSYSTLDTIVLIEPVYRRSYRMIREVNNFSVPVIGSCGVSNTGLWYDYWLPIDPLSPSSCIFVTSFVSSSSLVGYKLRGFSLFFKNARYGKYC